MPSGRRNAGKAERDAPWGTARTPKAAPPRSGPQSRESHLLAGRDAELLYGRHSVLEALLAGRRKVQRVFVAAGAQHSAILDAIVAAAQTRGCPMIEVPRDELERAAPFNHQGVAAFAQSYPYADLDALLVTPGDRIFLALDHLQDVQNLGTLLRTAEAMAVTGVILPGRRAAGITPAVSNASAGAVEHLPVALVGNLVQALERLKETGVWVIGLAGDPQATPLERADLTGPLALVVGAEGAGLSRLARERCDWLLSIPMYGRVESLNAAVAGSIVLAAARQSRPKASSAALL